MRYYISKCDWFDTFSNTIIHYGQLFTFYEVNNMKFNKVDLSQLFYKIETPQTNTVKLYGIRKLINPKKVKIYGEN